MRYARTVVISVAAVTIVAVGVFLYVASLPSAYERAREDMESFDSTDRAALDSMHGYLASITTQELAFAGLTANEDTVVVWFFDTASSEEITAISSALSAATEEVPGWPRDITRLEIRDESSGRELMPPVEGDAGTD
jgi:hypothetical protein